MKFRKKPAVIEAEQFFPGPTIPAGVVVEIGAGVEWTPTRDRYYIRTLEGELNVSPGDWIITGVQGEKYPCKDSIFRMTYEPAED